MFLCSLFVCNQQGGPMVDIWTSALLVAFCSQHQSAVGIEKLLGAGFESGPHIKFATVLLGFPVAQATCFGSWFIPQVVSEAGVSPGMRPDL